MGQAITIERIGQRVYFSGNTYPIKDQIKNLGGHWDSEESRWWVGAAKLAKAEALVAGLASAPAKAEDLDRSRVLAKVKYKGRPYFVIAESHDQGRCRLVPFAEGQPAFWAAMADCDLVRTYSPREYRGRTEYTTVGSIRRYAEDQRQAEAEGIEPCCVCGKRRPLVHDLEDGIHKCYSCCDMPAEGD